MKEFVIKFIEDKDCIISTLEQESEFHLEKLNLIMKKC